MTVHSERRALAVANLGGECVDCGAVEALEIDHTVPGARRAALAAGRRPSKDAVEDAAAGRTDGLQLLCGRGSENKCHQKKTTAERRKLS